MRFTPAEEVEFAVRLGRRIAALRAACDLSRREMAMQMDVHAHTIERWELGESMPNAFQLERLRHIRAIARSKRIQRARAQRAVEAQW